MAGQDLKGKGGNRDDALSAPGKPADAVAEFLVAVAPTMHQKLQEHSRNVACEMTATLFGIRGRDRAAVLDALGLVETGRIAWRPDVGDWIADGDPWLVIWSGRYIEIPADALAALSAKGEAVACQAFDTVMHSEARAWRDGVQVWSLVHDPENGVTDLKVEGSPPPELERLRQIAIKEQAEDDRVDVMFDVPADLLKAATGLSVDPMNAAPGSARRVVAMRAVGKAGETQAAELAQSRLLEAQIGERLFPKLKALGFEPVAQHPAFAQFYPGSPFNAFVRRRGEWSDAVEVMWDTTPDGPLIVTEFMVRRGSEPRYGRAGAVTAAGPKRSFLQTLTGTKPDVTSLIPQRIAEAEALLDDMDRYLRDGQAHPAIRPPVYTDDPGA